jgi:hypothetical protein
MNETHALQSTVALTIISQGSVLPILHILKKRVCQASTTVSASGSGSSSIADGTAHGNATGTDGGAAAVAVPAADFPVMPRWSVPCSPQIPGFLPYILACIPVCMGGGFLCLNHSLSVFMLCSFSL